MRMDEGLDTGPMYVQESLDIDPRETAATLHDRLATLGAAVLRRHLDEILAGRLRPTPQDDSGHTYAPMIRKEAGAIHWTQDAAALDRLIRAMTPWPGAFTLWDGAPLKVLRARAVFVGLPPERPGRVVRHADGVAVVAGRGGLLLEEVQLPGKRAMPAGDFARGRPEWIGAVLGE